MKKGINIFLLCAVISTARLISRDFSTVYPEVQVLSTVGGKTALSMQLLAANKQIGEALYSYAKTTATLSSLFIEEAYRQQGNGSKLFRLVCAMLKKKGCTELTFKACPFTYARSEQSYYLTDLVSFFEKLGARVIRYEDYVHGLPTTAVMKLDL